jgi:hypothetical protein
MTALTSCKPDTITANDLSNFRSLSDFGNFFALHQHGACRAVHPVILPSAITLRRQMFSLKLFA